jgi:exonuclease SbcD
MTSLVHIGDFHAAPGPRNADRYRALDQIIRGGLALERLGAWLWPGDLNHARMSIDDRNALADRLQRMAAAAPVLIVPGNHDAPGDLEIFGRLKTGWPITVIERPACIRIRLAGGGNATVFCLPYPTKAGLTALGAAPDEIVPAAAEALDHIFMQAAGELAQARAAGDLTLMIGHVNVAGSLTSVGQPNIGHEIEIGPRHLDRLGDIYKGLNHIHKAQAIAGAHYAGSVCRLDWGEVEEKRYLVIEFEDAA